MGGVFVEINVSPGLWLHMQQLGLL